MDELQGNQVQAHNLLGQKTQTPQRKDTSLTRTLRSCE